MPLKDRIQHLNLGDDMLNEFVSMLDIFKETSYQLLQVRSWGQMARVEHEFQRKFHSIHNQTSRNLSIYHHVIAAHLEAILDASKPQGFNSLASNESIEAAPHIVKAIGQLINLNY